MSDKKTVSKELKEEAMKAEAEASAKMAEDGGAGESKPLKESDQNPAPKKETKPDTSEEDARIAAELLESSIGEANVIAGGAGGRLTIREALMGYFSPTDLVTIKNPFSFHTGWVYSDPKDVRVEQPSAETRRVYGIGREFAKTRVLRAGQDIVIPGWEAYVGLTRFFKQWCQEKYKGNIAVAINNPATFRQFMKLVYGGKFDPNAGKNTEISNDEAARAALERDLGLVG